MDMDTPRKRGEPLGRYARNQTVPTKGYNGFARRHRSARRNQRKRSRVGDNGSLKGLADRIEEGSEPKGVRECNRQLCKEGITPSDVSHWDDCRRLPADLVLRILQALLQYAEQPRLRLCNSQLSIARSLVPAIARGHSRAQRNLRDRPDSSQAPLCMP